MLLYAEKFGTIENIEHCFSKKIKRIKMAKNTLLDSHEYCRALKKIKNPKIKTQILDEFMAAKVRK